MVLQFAQGQYFLSVLFYSSCIVRVKKFRNSSAPITFPQYAMQKLIKYLKLYITFLDFTAYGNVCYSTFESVETIVNIIFTISYNYREFKAHINPFKYLLINATEKEILKKCLINRIFGFFEKNLGKIENQWY